MVLSPYNISYQRFQQQDIYDGYEILKNKCLIQNYFNGTILTADVNLNATFHKPTTVQTCLPHFWIMKILRCRQAISQPFFLHYRDMQYCFGWRRHQQQQKRTILPKHRFVHVQQLNNQLVFLLMFFVLFLIPSTLYCLGSGCRIATTGPLCDEAVATTHFHYKKSSNLLWYFFGWLLGVLQNVFLIAICVCFRGGSFPKCRWWEDIAKGAAMWRIFLLVSPWTQSD